MRRLFALLAAVGGGWLVAHLLPLGHIDRSVGYAIFVTAVLAIGLYASTRGIVLAEFRDQLGTVTLAVTVGVLLKVALIAGVMFVAFGRHLDAIVLAIAVAQIDPLSVAAMLAKSRMTESAKALLSAWAAFDDPVTVLLTVYFATFAVATAPTGIASTTGVAGTAAGQLAGGGSLVADLGLNLALASVAFVVWRVFPTRPARVRGSIPVSRAPGRLATVPTVLAGLTVLVLAGIAVWQSALLAVALIGLFFRPPLGRVLDIVVQLALYVGGFAMGLLLVGDQPLTGPGIVLGCAAFVSQIIVGFLLTLPPRWRGDRVRLALGQQNGLTAIILALLLEPAYPGAIGTIAVAVLTVSVLNMTTNWLWDRVHPPVVPSPVVTRPKPPREAPVPPETVGFAARAGGTGAEAAGETGRAPAAIDRWRTAHVAPHGAPWG